MQKGTATAGSGSAVGGFFGVFCPACVPLMGSFFTAIGLGALVNFKVLSVITIGFLLIGLVGLFFNYKIHKQWYFLVIGILASTAIFIGRYLVEITPLLYISGIVLIGNIFFDYKTLKQCKKCKVKNG